MKSSIVIDRQIQGRDNRYRILMKECHMNSVLNNYQELRNCKTEPNHFSYYFRTC